MPQRALGSVGSSSSGGAESSCSSDRQGLGLGEEREAFGHRS